VAEGRVAVVTGAGRGIGRAIALRLAEAGMRVVVNYYVNREAAEATAGEIRARGVQAHIVQADMKDPAQIRALFDEVGAVFGGLDILVSNAASGVFRGAGELTAKHWDWMMHTHPRAFLLCAQAAVPLMQGRRGRMIAVSSIGSQRTIPNYAGLGAAKAALESLTRYLAVEYGPLGIAVNAVSGGAVSTTSWTEMPEAAAVLAEIARRTPAGRIAEPEDIAAAVVFLCGPDADMIRGQVLVVDGGYSLPLPGC
jgi:enoyl-[acyl-carrier protein] reductase III